ncbi:WxL domain-containing protein [Enterococcus casseliflavus]|uniref:WxL domain-containing protein n=1 Tax=Enterococcus casseliflavus TaxID=37734 RepID=UPI0039A40A3C
MKLVRLATVAALTTTILAGGAIGAFAEEEGKNEVRNVETYGNIEFTPSTDEELEVVPPEQGPDGPDVEIPTEVPETTGPLSIVKAAHMNFGKQVISNKDLSYNMVAEMQQLRGTAGDENKVPYVSFAQVQDVRGKYTGWDLNVDMSEFASGTENNILTGAQIIFEDSRIQYEGENQELAPSNHAPELVLEPGKGGVTVMSAKANQGAGVSSVVWGNQADLNAQFADDEIEVVENSAIKLFVPGNTVKDATTYTSTLTWELTTTPGADAGTTI